MMVDVIGFLGLPFLLRMKIHLALVGNLFIFLGAFAISIVVYHSGGIWSPVIFWIAAIPIMAAFLVNRKSSILWGLFAYGALIFFGASASKGISFPELYNVEYKSLFMLTSLSGFMLIILMVALVFQFNTSQALNRLEEANTQMTDLNTEKDYIIQIMAHDLRNPLHIIKTWLEILMSSNEKVESTKEVYMMMEQSVNRSVRLIDKVTKVGEIDQNRLQVALKKINIAEIALEVMEAYHYSATLKNINLKKDWEELEYCANVDGTYFNQILDNLVSNAVKYTRKGGAVLIKMDKVDNHIEIRVKDEGPGISREDQDMLFQKFSRIKSKPTGGESSTGVGLYLVKKYINLMGGSVWCESEPDKGSTFVITVPEISK